MNNITIRNARIIYRNFSGRKDQYNPNGNRQFSVVIEDAKLAEALLNDGWNVKPLNSRNENEPQAWHLPVAVVYGKYPPAIRQISQSGGFIHTEGTVGNLDVADVISADMIIRPRDYDVRGQTGIKAYLKSMNIRIQEDELEEEYNKQYGIYQDDGTDPF